MPVCSSLAVARDLGPAAAALLAVVGVLVLSRPAGADMIGTGAGPRVIAAADLNEDGITDLVSGNDGDLMVSVHLGRGNGTFRPKVQYACTSAPTSIAIADLSQDGHLDVAITCAGLVRIRFGAGDGTLGPPTDHAVTSPVALVATQFNDQTDSFMDLLVVNHPAGSTVNYLRGTGGGAFSLVAYASTFRSVHLAAADVDEDGHQDLVFANATDSVAIFRGSGLSNFFGFERYRVQGAPATVVVADFDEDGFPDIAATIPTANAVNILFGNGDGTFQPYVSHPAGTSPQWLACGDFNGDDAPDLAVTAAGGSTVGILLNTGVGTFQPKVDYPAGVGTQAVALAQLEGDLSTDLAVAAGTSNSICTLENNGDGTFEVPAGPVYVWGPASGAATTAANWIPARTSPTNSDVLVFNRGGALTVSNVGSSTVGQLMISGGSETSFSGSGLSTLTVSGGTGDDVVIEQGSKAVLASAGNPLTVNIGSAANADIKGDLELRTNANNRFQALGTDGIVFYSGGRAVIGSGASAIPFGNGTGASGFNSVRFMFGSQLVAQTGISVFGAVAPNAVVQFSPGSRYRHMVASAPPASGPGRTYADFEYDVPGGGTVLGGTSSLDVDSLIVTSGTLTVATTGAVTIRGNIAVDCTFAPDPGALKFLPASPMTVRLAGNVRQYMRPFWNCANAELFHLAPNVTLNIDNPAGVEFFHGFRMAASVSFTNGSIHSRRVLEHGLHRYRVVIDSSGTITGASASTGWFACPLMRRATSDGLLRMDIGDSISFQPVDVDLHGVTSAGYFTAATAPEDHWAVASAQLDMQHLAHRSWSLWAANDWLGAPATWFSNADATLSFAAADLSPGSDPLQFAARMYKNFTGPWSPSLSHGNQTATSIRVTAIPLSAISPGGGSSFQVGQPVTPSLSVQNVSGDEGTGSAPARIAPMRTQSTGDLTFRVRLSQPAIVPVSVDYGTADGSATTADGDYTPVSGTLNFAPGDTAQDVVVAFGIDTTPERNETFALAITNATNATIATPAATGTILDDDDQLAPTATVTSPNGGELFFQQQQVQLQWTATDNVAVSSVDLYLVKGGNEEALAIGHPNTGSYTWTASGTASNQVRFRVVAHDDPGHDASDDSDAVWELSQYTAGVDDAPLVFALTAASPSVAGRTRIEFALPHATDVELTIHDVQGRTLARLADGLLKAGRHQRTWDTSRAASGMYFVRFAAPGFHAERRLIVIR